MPWYQISNQCHLYGKFLLKIFFNVLFIIQQVIRLTCSASMSPPRWPSFYTLAQTSIKMWRKGTTRCRCEAFKSFSCPIIPKTWEFEKTNGPAIRFLLRYILLPQQPSSICEVYISERNLGKFGLEAYFFCFLPREVKLTYNIWMV